MVSSRQVAGPSLQIYCSVCRQEVSATSYQYGECATVLGMRVSPYTETNYVECPQCGEQFVSSVSVFDLPVDDLETASAHLQQRIRPIHVTLVVSGLLLAWMPLVGLLWNWLTLLLTARRRHWMRTLNWIGALLSLLVTLVYYTWSLLLQ